MMEKRKSATDIFNEQSISQEESYNEPMDQFDDLIQQTNAPAELNLASGIQMAKEMPAMQQMAQPRKKNKPPVISSIKSSEDLQLEKEPIKVRITGFGIWKKVIVPPNAYVVHTRIHRKNPVTLGLGLSFNYNPDKDSFLVIPAAMQTIGIVANCISREKQGINVLAYVQWQIEDFSVAYKKLDFSDSRDPLGIVNAQLREQAEAAIKDKIATMSVEEVLTDKAPVIEELTSRLKQVAEGQLQGDNLIREGLGIKIITVQIREALVSSTTLWEYLQSPFRNEERKKSSISYLETQNEIQKKELESRKERETREAEARHQIELIRQKKETEIQQLNFKEASIRYQNEQENVQKKLKLEEQTRVDEREREFRLFQMEQDLKYKQIELEESFLKKETEFNTYKQKQLEELENLKLQYQLGRNSEQEKNALRIQEEQNRVTHQYEEGLLQLEKVRQEIRNLMGSNAVVSELIQKLPEIARHLPQIKELKVLQTGQSDPVFDNLAVFIQKIMALAENLGIKLQK